MEETETHLWKKISNCTFKTIQIKVFGPQKIQISMQGIKSAKLEIANREIPESMYSSSLDFSAL